MEKSEDLGLECHTVTDNLPCDWKIFYSKSIKGVCYLITDDECLLFNSINSLEDYVDSLEESDTDTGSDYP